MSFYGSSQNADFFCSRQEVTNGTETDQERGTEGS